MVVQDVLHYVRRSPASVQHTGKLSVQHYPERIVGGDLLRLHVGNVHAPQLEQSQAALHVPVFGDEPHICPPGVGEDEPSGSGTHPVDMVSDRLEHAGDKGSLMYDGSVLESHEESPWGDAGNVAGCGIAQVYEAQSGETLPCKGGLPAACRACDEDDRELPRNRY